jgi:MtN3 and saliva related transmembrane protein
LKVWDPAYAARFSERVAAARLERGMETNDLIGWAAVSVLFLTMSGQAWKEWRDRVKHGMSKWFFVGQVTASILFLVYSALVGNRVFVVGNALVLVAAIAGGAILAYNRKHR